MTHLAARSLATCPVPRAATEAHVSARGRFTTADAGPGARPMLPFDTTSATTAWVSAGYERSGLVAAALLRQLQNFLESGGAYFHNPVMGAVGNARPAIKRRPTADGRSQNTLDILVALSMSSSARDNEEGAFATSVSDADPCLDGTEFTVDPCPFEHTMIGTQQITNPRHLRFGENIHAKTRKSAAVAPILHKCVTNGCVTDSRTKHDGGWSNLSDRGATPNERSGR